jgi:hypothetical protein
MSDAPVPTPPAPLPVRGASETLLLTHAVLVGLTPLIPIPILDDAVKAAIERRMVREVARASGQELDDKTVEVLAGEEDGSVLVSIAKGIVTFPLKLVFRKLFVVLEVKRASDLASKTYHRGRLLDLALASSIVGPRGPIPPAQVRIAMDAACAAVGLSPLGYAFTSVFQTSKGALESLGKDLLKRLGKGGAAKVVDVVEEQAKSEPRAAGVVARLEEAVRTVPREHFDEIEARFEERLGIRLTRR